jgi:hypothetical protein
VTVGLAPFALRPGSYSTRDLLGGGTGAFSLGNGAAPVPWVPVHVLAPMTTYVLELTRAR